MLPALEQVTSALCDDQQRDLTRFLRSIFAQSVYPPSFPSPDLRGIPPPRVHVRILSQATVVLRCGYDSKGCHGMVCM